MHYIIPAITLLSTALAAPAPDLLKDLFQKPSTTAQSLAAAATTSTATAVDTATETTPKNNTITLSSLLDLGNCNPLGCAKEITDIVFSCTGAIMGHGINVPADVNCVANSIKVGIPTANNDCTTCLNDALGKVLAVTGKVVDDFKEWKEEDEKKSEKNGEGGKKECHECEARVSMSMASYSSSLVVMPSPTPFSARV
ncbi:hypothetical protein BDV25DRAFT_115089 [Aspergillus avenaceus]|uniref:Uncharacterized protein n=1 Tax=Aspergillus avenaceus TaxID=36643 RepID=A0A5N6TV39_ASPAV|nr:hypothetical protein BDV25DRAFT_115089 [Aspergillus avenaceus]